MCFVRPENKAKVWLKGSAKRISPPFLLYLSIFNLRQFFLSNVNQELTPPKIVTQNTSQRFNIDRSNIFFKQSNISHTELQIIFMVCSPNNIKIKHIKTCQNLLILIFTNTESFRFVGPLNHLYRQASQNTQRVRNDFCSKF